MIQLNTERLANYQKKLCDLLGQEEGGYLTSMTFTLRYLVGGSIKSWLSKQETELKFSLIDNAKINKVKIEAAEEGKVPYVSCNDVITSWFMRQVNSSTAMMAISMRNRIDGLSKIDAGNYEHVIFYRREDYASPALIRKSLAKYRRLVTQNLKLPKAFESMFEEEAFVTNWQTLAEDFDIEGCEEDLHVPVFTSKSWPTTIPLLVIFRARRDKIGMCYVKTGKENHLDHCNFAIG